MRSPASTWLWGYLVLVAFAATGSIAAKFGDLELGLVTPVLAALTVITGAAAIFAPMWTEVGPKATLLALVSLFAIGLLSELVGSHGGLPFGMYSYTDQWWPAIRLPTGLYFPLLATIAWMLMAGGAFMVIAKTFKPTSGIAAAVLAGLLAAMLEIPMEPVMTGVLGYWQWVSQTFPIGGPLLGAPFMNVVGWFLTVTVGGFVLAGYRAQEGASFQAGAVLWAHMSLTMLAGALQNNAVCIVLLPLFVALLALTLWSRSRHAGTTAAH